MTKQSADNSDLDGGSVNASRIQSQLININDVEKYCRPHNLSLYDPINSGFKYNVIGLFGIPDQISLTEPCVFAVLGSVFPPGEPYK